MEVFSEGDDPDESDNETDYSSEWASVSFTSMGTDALVFVPTLCERRILQPTARCAHSHVRSIAKQLAFLGSIWRRRSRSCGYVMKLSPLLPSY